MDAAKRLHDQLRRVGEAKAATVAADVAEHLSLPPGKRLERVVGQSRTLLALSREAGKALPPEDDVEVWLRVYRHLHRSAQDG